MTHSAIALAAVRDALQRTEYKEGYTFDLSLLGVLTIKYVHRCTRHLDSASGVTYTSNLTFSNAAPMDFLVVDGQLRIDRYHQWMRHLLHMLETHEADEWFRFDGAMVNDPHVDPPPTWKYRLNYQSNSDKYEIVFHVPERVDA